MITGLTEEQIKKSRHYNHLSRKILNVPKGYVMHHKDESLRYNDPDRYIEWRPEDLIVITREEHAFIHKTYENMRNANINRDYQPVSEDVKKRISEKLKGHYYMSKDGKERMRKSHIGVPPVNKGMHWKLIDGKRVYYK